MDGQETFTLGCEDKQVNIHVILYLYYTTNVISRSLNIFLQDC